MTYDDVKFDEATAADLPAMVSLLQLLFTQEAEMRPNPEKQARGLRLILEDPRVGRLYAVREAGRVLGMASLLFTVSTAEGARAAWLEDVIINPDRRGAGLGRRLLEYVLMQAQELGVVRVSLMTDRDNQRAQRLYTALGFCASAMLPMRASLPIGAG